MIVIETSVVVPRALTEVEPFVSDVANDPKWNPEIRAAKSSTSGSEATVRYDCEVQPFMGITSCRMTVARDPAAHVTRVAGSPVSWIDALATYTFEPVAGGTRVTRRCEIQVKGIMRLVEPLMRREMRKRKDAMLDGLRAYYTSAS